MRIACIAPSGRVAIDALHAGCRRLKRVFGVTPWIHPACYEEDGFYAGSDRVRALALYESAFEADILWCARGGSGAMRLLPLLDTMKAPPSNKLLVGFSDATALFDYVRSRWGWSTLHAPMPATRMFASMRVAHLQELEKYLTGHVKCVWRLERHGPSCQVRAPLIGGNLAVLSHLMGTDFEPFHTQSILFLEDIDEPFYKIARMLTQFKLSPKFRDSVRAIVLGSFSGCRDTSGAGVTLLDLFRDMDLPVFSGLPMGHGMADHAPLVLGGMYELKGHSLRLLSWDWRLDADAVIR